MSVRGWLGGALASIGILVIGWQAGESTLATSTIAATTPVAGGSPSATGPGSGAASNPSSPSASSASSGSDGTWVGDAVRTAWGPMQVQATISGGRITDVTPLQITGPDRHSVQISNAAVPLLRQEVLSAQSANVSMIGGATYTSAGYLRSLQSALDQAGF